jgi:hypothetical protein
MSTDLNHYFIEFELNGRWRRSRQEKKRRLNEDKENVQPVGFRMISSLIEAINVRDLGHYIQLKCQKREKNRVNTDPGQD